MPDETWEFALEPDADPRLTISRSQDYYLIELDGARLDVVWRTRLQDGLTFTLDNDDLLDVRLEGGLLPSVYWNGKLLPALMDLTRPRLEVKRILTQMSIYSVVMLALGLLARPTPYLLLAGLVMLLLTFFNWQGFRWSLAFTLVTQAIIVFGISGCGILFYLIELRIRAPLFIEVVSVMVGYAAALGVTPLLAWQTRSLLVNPAQRQVLDSVTRRLPLPINGLALLAAAVMLFAALPWRVDGSAYNPVSSILNSRGSETMPQVFPRPDFARQITYTLLIEGTLREAVHSERHDVLVGRTDETLFVHDPHTERTATVPLSFAVEKLALTPDGQQVAVYYDAGRDPHRIEVYTLPRLTDKRSYSLAVPGEHARLLTNTHLLYHPYTTDETGTVNPAPGPFYAMHLTSGTITQVLTTAPADLPRFTDFAVHPHDERAYTIAGDRLTRADIAWENGLPVRIDLTAIAPVQAAPVLAFSEDGTILATSTGSLYLSLSLPENDMQYFGQFSDRYGLMLEPVAVDHSRERNQFAAVSRFGVTLYDAVTLDIEGTVNVSYALFGMRAFFSADGSHLYVLYSWDGVLSLQDSVLAG